MTNVLRPAITILALMTGFTGLAYPAVVTAVAQVAFPHQANGSLIKSADGVLGSELIGQPISDPKYFWSRPSATAPANNGAASSGSNLGPTNPALLDAVKGRVEALRAADPENAQKVPVDLVTTSGSGLDPHISPAAALYQVPRIARIRGVPEVSLRALVESRIEGRAIGVLGEPRVNVLLLNFALDRLAPAPSAGVLVGHSG